MTRLRAASLNVNGGDGVSAAERPVKEVIAQLSRGRYDVALFQEFPETLLPSLCDSLRGWSIRSWMLSDLSSGDDGSMGLVTVTRRTIRHTQRVPFPNPGLEMEGSEDQVYRSHDKGALVLTLEVPGWSDYVRVANLHALPFHRFGLAEDSREAADVWQTFDQRLREAISPDDPYVLIGGDFNSSKRRLVNGVLDRWHLTPVFPATPTRALGRTTDDFYVHVDGGRASKLGEPQHLGSDHLQIAVELESASSNMLAMSSRR